MPVVPVLKGSVTVVGTSRETEATIYMKTVKAYGETLGELLDGLVKAAATIAGDVFQWSLFNRPEGYKLSDDLWYMTSYHPDLFDIATASPAPNETANGAHLDTVENLVRNAVVIRNVTCFMNLAKLKHLGVVDVNASMEEGKDSSTMGNDIPFDEMVTYGFTGEQLDALLREAMLAGRLPATLFNRPAVEDQKN